jgi:hypothetical protein
MRHVPLKLRLSFEELYGLIFQKKELFITTAVITSNCAIIPKEMTPYEPDDLCSKCDRNVWISFFAALSKNQLNILWIEGGSRGET